jgi:hypothetical protein
VAESAAVLVLGVVLSCARAAAGIDNSMAARVAARKDFECI